MRYRRGLLYRRRKGRQLNNVLSYRINFYKKLKFVEVTNFKKLYKISKTFYQRNKIKKNFLPAEQHAICTFSCTIMKKSNAFTLILNKLHRCINFSLVLHRHHSYNTHNFEKKKCIFLVPNFCMRNTAPKSLLTCYWNRSPYIPGNIILFLFSFCLVGELFL